MDTFAITEGLVPESNSQDGGPDAEKASNAGKLPEGGNKFQRAIAAWRGKCLINSGSCCQSFRHATDIVGSY